MLSILYLFILHTPCPGLSEADHSNTNVSSTHLDNSSWIECIVPSSVAKKRPCFDVWSAAMASFPPLEAKGTLVLCSMR